MNASAPRSVVIFTVGFHARATFRFLARQPGCRVLGFVDNNPAAQGRLLFDLPVWSPSALAELDCDLIAVPGRNQQAILTQLRDVLGIEPSRLWLVRKSEVPPASDELARRGADLERLLRETISVLAAAGCDYWAMHSSLLALMRGQDLALFSDVDLCVTAEKFEMLQSRFRAAGIVSRATLSPTEKALVELSITLPPAREWHEPAVIDLHPLTLGPAAATWLVNSKPLSLQAKHFIGHATAEYRGLAVRVPLEAEAITAELYGLDWREPAETWNGRYALNAVTPLAATLVA
jgi:hypothetical protein